MSKPSEPAREFSVEIDLAALGRGSRSFHLAAGEEERERIAARIDAPAVARLEGDICLAASKSEIRVTGRLRASLMRECVVSLETLTETIDETFDVLFLRRPQETPTVAPDGAADGDGPEIHTGETFDLGELLAQQLALAMNPFPRKKGAPSLVDQYGGAEDDSPFAVLQRKNEKN